MSTIGTLVAGAKQGARKPARKVKPDPAVFGPLRSATEPIARNVVLARDRVKRAQAKLPEPPKRQPSLPPPAPRHGTALGAFQANEPLAPVLRARTQARVNTAKGYGYGGSRKMLGQIGAEIQKSSADRIPDKRDGHGGSLLATVMPLGAAAHAGGLLAHGHVPSLGEIAAIAPGAPILTRALGNVAQATAEHPGAVTGHTATGTADIIAGTPAGLAALLTGTFSSHPLAPWKRLAETSAADVSRRYGPLLTGHDAEFRKRIVQEGAAPELLDATAVLGGGAAVAGRALGRAARAGSLGERALRVATERPALRVSGDLAVPQDVHPNLFRAYGQAAQDKLRTRRHEGKVSKAMARETGTPGLEPQAGEVVPLSKRLAARRQRVAVSRRGAQSYLANRHEQAAELSRGVEKDLAALAPKQRRAVYHVMQGLVPLHGDVGAVRRALETRKAQILRHREAHGVPADPRTLSKHTELRTIDFLHEHADEVFGNGALADFHARNIDRSVRLGEGDPALLDATAEVRRHRPQGEALGVPYQYEVRVNAIREAEAQALKDVSTPGDAARIRGHFEDRRKALEADKPALDARFVAEVRAKAERAGLPEPAYFQHAKRPEVRVSTRTAANVARAVAGTRKTELKLFREGRAVTDANVFVQGLAQNIKRKHQWKAVGDVAAQHTFPWSRGAGGKGMRLDELKSEIERRGLDLNDFEFYKPGRFQTYIERNGGDSVAHAHHALDDAIVKPGQVKTLSEDQLRSTSGFFAVPRGVGDELKAQITPSGKPTRVFGRAQGFQSAAILGLNPSWLQMQVAANTLQAGLGMRGRFKDLAAGQAFYRGLSPEERAHLDLHANAGILEGHGTSPHLGHYQGKFAKAAERAGQVPIVPFAGRRVRLTDANPIRLMFRLDQAQNHVFRMGVLYNAAKKQAFRDLARDVGHAQASQARVSQLLRLKPGEQLDAQIKRVLENPQQVEKLGEHVDRVLGDYLRYTAKERRYFKPYVLFYGFLRYALKTLFYTLPVKHPIAAALTAKVGQLHDEEIRQIFGTRDVPPWVLSRLFLYGKDGKVRRNAQGLPESIDLARINPVTTPLTEVVQRGPRALTGLVSPMVQAMADQIYSRNSFTGQGFKVGGSAEDNPNPDYPTRGRIVADQVLSSAFPYREAKKLLYPGKQGDDSLLGSPRPIRYKTAGPQAKEAQRRAALPSAGAQLAQDLAPFAFPRGDTTEAYLKQHPGGGKSAGLPVSRREYQSLLREASGAGAAVSRDEYRSLLREARAGG